MNYRSTLLFLALCMFAQCSIADLVGSKIGTNKRLRKYTGRAITRNVEECVRQCYTKYGDECVAVDYRPKSRICHYTNNSKKLRQSSGYTTYRISKQSPPVSDNSSDNKSTCAEFESEYRSCAKKNLYVRGGDCCRQTEGCGSGYERKRCTVSLCCSSRPTEPRPEPRPPVQPQPPTVRPPTVRPPTVQPPVVKPPTERPGSGSGSGTVSFLAVGDVGNPNSRQRSVLRAMGNEARRIGSDSVLNLGDNFYDVDRFGIEFEDGIGKKDSRRWEIFFDDVKNANAEELTWYSVLGNHDYGEEYDELKYAEYQITDAPNDKWRMDDHYYSFTKQSGNTKVKVIAFDSQAIAKDIRINTRNGREDPDDQFEYVEREINNADPDAWIIVMSHHPLFSTTRTRNYNKKFLERLKRDDRVSIYISGHDHAMEAYQLNDKKWTVLSGAGSNVKHPKENITPSLQQRFVSEQKRNHGAEQQYIEYTLGFNTIVATENQLRVEYKKVNPRDSNNVQTTFSFEINR